MNAKFYQHETERLSHHPNMALESRDVHARMVSLLFYGLWTHFRVGFRRNTLSPLPFSRTCERKCLGLASYAFTSLRFLRSPCKGSLDPCTRSFTYRQLALSMRTSFHILFRSVLFLNRRIWKNRAFFVYALPFYCSCLLFISKEFDLSSLL